jgi:hypothetical protein
MVEISLKKWHEGGTPFDGKNKVENKGEMYFGGDRKEQKTYDIQLHLKR